MKKLILLLLFIPLISFSQEKEFDFSKVETVPIYPGCEVNMKHKFKSKSTNLLLRNCFQEKILTHIKNNFRYPYLAEKKEIQGRVFVQFTIGEGGYIDNIRTRGPHVILEKEAKRIISLLPRFKPGSQFGKPVRVPFSIPIIFRLQ